VLVPKDILHCPYFLFTSHGIHTHPPPPPVKQPADIMDGIKNLIREIREPNLTLSKFT
jgi:hypothetical protein